MKISKADIVTLLGLIFGWTSLLFTINQSFPFAIIFLFLAFSCDLLDGTIARMSKENTSEWGTLLDSLADSLIYIVVPLLMALNVWQLPRGLFIICSSLVIAASFYRLARFSVIGIKRDAKGMYYEGLIVVYQAALLLLGFAVGCSDKILGSYILLFSMLFGAPLMICKNVKSRKPSLKTALFLAIPFFIILYVTATY